MRKPATIQDIARAAGVSTATVSRALSHPERVAEATRSLVLDAVRRSGYRVNRTARNLRRRRSGSILALVPNLANPFFSEILSGLSSVLAESGHGLLVGDTHIGPHPAARLNDYLAAGMADGVVIFDSRLPDGMVFEGARPPMVLACEWSRPNLPSVRVDNEGGAALAIRHLLRRGHRAIGHLTGPSGNVLTESRLAGTRQALSEAGLKLAPDHLFPGDFGLGSGASAAERWLALRDRPTAVFCASDEMACGFMGALRHAGIDVPGAVSVVGFDDIEVSAHLVPALTTIRQPRRLIGERAARLLLAMIEAGSSQAPAELLPVQLIERQSVAPPATTPLDG
ncbi:LacI family DNA-binding transcriptional regulator [Aureimonas populi]|uniref:LacI family DNA-binding transcriptional regulator n=1 Tax=Aureimonas populi TaxID=1701758 RepID=A0ABW5CJZ1_9HYPH|nr:LacI family DNA-binding transcriptional regulator [Aureimonas populi]